MKLKLLPSFIFYLLLGITPIATAQEVLVSKQTEVRNGEKVFVHKVEKGQTLYSIAKAYKTEVSLIEKMNPALAAGIKSGSVIYIPIKDAQKMPGPGTYTVQAGDGLYAIARKNGVSIEQLKTWNPGIDTLLKPGHQLVLFPQEKTVSAKAVAPKAPALQAANDGFLHVACLLPFYLDKNTFEEPEPEQGERPERAEKPSEISGKSYKALEFYAGMRFALDSLERAGHKIILHTLDCPQDTESVERVLQSSELALCHLVLGPFQPAFNHPVAEYCKRNHKWYLSLFSQQTKLLLNNAQVCKLSASASTQARSITKIISTHFSGSRILLVHNNLKKEKILVDTYRNAFSTAGKDSAITYVFKGNGAAGLKNKLDANKANLLVVCSNDQAFVTDFFNKMDALSDDYKLVVFGLESWQDYENIPYETLEKFSVHFPVSRYSDYASGRVVSLLEAYRATCNTDPGEYAMLATDLALGIFPLFAGGKFPDESSLTQLNYKGYCTGFSFEKTSPESGYENTYSRVMHYLNMQLQPYDEH